mmetsp:Transcript_28437/g.82312  ORF Transcript_28437/g.82312 Transcript_28437/m.82312 type:complete len:204 (-) Transcript_28437:514-1125(-)
MHRGCRLARPPGLRLIVDDAVEQIQERHRLVYRRGQLPPSAAPEQPCDPRVCLGSVVPVRRGGVGHERGRGQQCVLQRRDAEPHRSAEVPGRGHASAIEPELGLEAGPVEKQRAHRATRYSGRRRGDAIRRCDLPPPPMPLPLGLGAYRRRPTNGYGGALRSREGLAHSGDEQLRRARRLLRGGLERGPLPRAVRGPLAGGTR